MYLFILYIKKPTWRHTFLLSPLRTRVTLRPRLFPTALKRKPNIFLSLKCTLGQVIKGTSASCRLTRSSTMAVARSRSGFFFFFFNLGGKKIPITKRCFDLLDMSLFSSLNAVVMKAPVLRTVKEQVFNGRKIKRMKEQEGRGGGEERGPFEHVISHSGGFCRITRTRADRFN